MKTKVLIPALFVAMLQIIVFTVAIPFVTLKDMYSWNCKRFFHVFLFNVRSMTYNVTSTWQEWKKY